MFGHEPGTLRSIDASGGVGFLHDIVKLAAGRTCSRRERRESLRVSTETIIAAAPEVIVELRYGADGVGGGSRRGAGAWNALPSVPAVRASGSTCSVGDRFVVPGPRVAEAAEESRAVIRQ